MSKIFLLSKGNSLDRFSDLKDEILLFMSDCSDKNAKKFLHLLQEDQFMVRVHFLSVIFEYLNILNLRLEGWQKTIIDLVEKLRAFKFMLNLFSNDLNSGRFLHFPRLGLYVNETSTAVVNTMTYFMVKLMHNFDERFREFNLPINIMMFAPFHSKITLLKTPNSYYQQLKASLQDGILD